MRRAAIRWRFVPEGGYGLGIFLGPSVKDGLSFAGSPAATVYAIEVESGRARWSTRIDSGAKVTVHQPHICRELVIAGYTRFAESPTGGIVALDHSKGTLRWRTEFPHRTRIPRRTRAVPCVSAIRLPLRAAMGRFMD